jgi:phospholipase C
LEQLIDTSNPDPNTNETQTAYPCFEHPTLTDLLDQKGLSWKYYTPVPGSIWTAPDAIQHMCGPNVPPPNGTVCTAPEWTNHVVVEGKNNQILNDIAAGQLADVSWVIPNGSASDHPNNPVDVGPSWVASIVNAIGTSAYWADTAIIVTWDDWGGWYDHVAPPAIHNSYEYGFRVPLIVVSPYAKAAHISHKNYDFGSILKFVETTFSLPEIDPAVHYADARAVDLSDDCFDFNQTPLSFTPIPAPQDANYFLNDKSPPTPPDDD